jgi:hypothetical protein
VCGSGECESVEGTPDCPQGCEPAATCEVAPAQTTGRCTCIGGGECPDGQLCRDELPYKNICAPSSDANCAPNQVKVEVLGCPNYCLY